MWIERCNHHPCRRPYQINEFGGELSGNLKPSAIVCPHCGHREVRWSESTFLVHALSAEQEQELNARQRVHG